MDIEPNVEIISSRAVPNGWAVFCFEKRVIGILRLSAGVFPPEDGEYDQVFFSLDDYATLMRDIDKLS